MGTTDRLLARIVVIVLGFVAVGGLAGVIALSILEKPITDPIIAPLSAALGALGAMLARVDGTVTTTNVENAENVNTPPAPPQADENLGDL